MKMKDKFIRKYMLNAKFFSEHDIPCLSRGIGAIIVDPIKNVIVGTGYNGPCKGVPHHDTREYLQEIVWPQLTEKDKNYIALSDYTKKRVEETWREKQSPSLAIRSVQDFCQVFSRCGICPRKLIGAKSGERMEICAGCEHGERNAIYNATGSTHGCYIFCWCGVPCNDCTRAIIQSGIKKVYCLNMPEHDKPGNNGYGFYRSRWFLKKA